jgi:hypothetical protein
MITSRNSTARINVASKAHRPNFTNQPRLLRKVIPRESQWSDVGKRVAYKPPCPFDARMEELASLRNLAVVTVSLDGYLLTAKVD